MKRRLFAFFAAVLMLGSSLCVCAKEPYEGYTYNSYGEKVPAPNAYLPDKVVTGAQLGIGQFANPADVFTDAEDNVYLVDSGNGRIVILNSAFQLKKVLDNFVLPDGTPSPLKDPQGVFAVLKEGLIYIADKGNSRVAVCDYNGVIVRQEFKPKTELLGDEIVFAPRKIVVNSIGTMFVLSENINQGMVAIDADGVFQGFFGAEKIQLTALQTADLMWRSILSKEQIQQTATFQPTEYANIFLGENDFIYTATALETYEKAQIKKLNPTGTNILFEDMRYGDLSPEMSDGNAVVSAIIDVTADENGFIYALDRNFGRIYMYDEQSWNLAIFGKKDNQTGCFTEPVSIETVGDNIVVVDAVKANLTVFSPTEYGTYIKEALIHHYKGRYAEALEPWEMVRRLNNNYEFAYAGIGRAQHMQGEYKEAMYNFKQANQQILYSKSKKKYRTIILRKNFTWLTIGFLAVCIGLYVLIKKRKKIAAFIAEKKKGGNSI